MFKKLNHAKFQVLNEMAYYLEFDPGKPGVLVSYLPFRKGMEDAERTNSLEALANSNIVALKSSNIEYFIPKAFGILFGGILLALILVVTLNWPPTKLVQPRQESDRSVTIVEQGK